MAARSKESITKAVDARNPIPATPDFPYRACRVAGLPALLVTAVLLAALRLTQIRRLWLGPGRLGVRM